MRARVWSDDGAVLTGTRRRSASVCPSKPHPRILTTARANGTEVTASLSKDLLVAANGCAGHADPEPTPCSSHAISHGKRDVACSRGMLPRLPPSSTARSARATPMLTGSTLFLVYCCSRRRCSSSRLTLLWDPRTHCHTHSRSLCDLLP